MEQQDPNVCHSVPGIISDFPHRYVSDQCENREIKGRAPRLGFPGLLDVMLLNSIPIDCHHYQHQNLDVLPF
jgi:hypothetical protein